MTWRTFRYDTVDSTNERAFDAIANGDARHGDLFIARSQTAGRGTHGRTWESAHGGLYVSAILKTPTMPPPGAWTIAGALAVRDVASAARVPATIDWPNDVVSINGEKIAGVLAESRGLKATGPAIFVLGIGINVEPTALSLPLRAERSVTSLRGLGADLDVGGVEQLLRRALKNRIGQVMDAPKMAYRDFFERCTLADQPVVVGGAEREVTGTWAGLDPSLGIRITGDDGRTQHISVAHTRSVRRR